MAEHIPGPWPKTEPEPVDSETPEPEAKPKPKPELMNPDGWPTKYGWRWIGEELCKVMPAKIRPGGVSKATGKKLPDFEYITARQVQARLDAVIGPGNWSTLYRVIDLAGPAVECNLSIFGVSKADVGYSNNPDAEHESEPLKAAYSDAFKRAAVAWGVGRFLYGDL